MKITKTKYEVKFGKVTGTMLPRLDETLTLEKAIDLLKKEGYVIYKPI